MYWVRECVLSLSGSGQGYYSDGNIHSDPVKTEFFYLLVDYRLLK